MTDKTTTVTTTGTVVAGEGEGEVVGTPGVAGVAIVPPVVVQQVPNLPKTQEEMDTVIKERLARAQESFKKDPAIVAALEAQKRLTELARTGMTEPEKLAVDLKAAQEQIDKTNRENAELKATQLKQTALSKANLPLSFADRLHGTTEDEVTVDLAALLTQLKAIATAPVNLSKEANPAAGNGSSPTIDQQIEEAQKKGDVMRSIALKNLKASQTKT